MTAPVIVGKEENTIEEIAHIIIDNKMGCVPIVEKDGKMVGLITETDFMVKECCVPFSRFNAPSCLVSGCLKKVSSKPIKTQGN